MRSLVLVPLLLVLACSCKTSPVAAPIGELKVRTNATDVRFIAVGDTGKGDEHQRNVAKLMADKCAKDECDFVLFLGDNIYPSGISSVDDPQMITRFENVYAEVPVPFYAVLGNHDYGGFGSGSDFARGQYEVDYSAKSKKWRMPGKTWHQVFKDLELFGMDTNMQVYEQDQQQREDLAKWLAASKATWKIVAGHHPYRSNGPHGNAGAYDGWGSRGAGAEVKSFFDDVVCGKADLALGGHDHSQQWLKETCNGTELLVSGAGSDTTTLPGTQPTWFQSSENGFVYFTVNRDTLTAEFIGPTGEAEFSRTLTKVAGDAGAVGP